MQYEHITIDTKIGDVIEHPAFMGKGNPIFPWDDKRKNHPEQSMLHAPDLHLWHTHMDPQQMVDGVNRLIDDINDGKQVIYDIYSEQEKEKDPEKRNTGLFFFRGNPGAPFGIICPAVCRGFPTAPHGFGIGTGTEAEGWMMRFPFGSSICCHP